MTSYIRDSLGVPIEEIKEELKIVGKTFNDELIYEDDEVIEFNVLRDGNFKTEYVFEKDIMEFIKTLDRSDMLDILLNFSTDEIVEASQSERVYLHE